MTVTPHIFCAEAILLLEDQVADLLTKPLPAEAHANLTDKLLHGFHGLEPRPSSVATPHQLRLRQLSRMRAAKKRLENYK